MTQTLFCRAEMNYVKGEEPCTLEVDILDGRKHPLPGWEERGFELMQHNSAVKDWTDEVQIQQIHYGEIADLARELSGCDQALVGSHIKRNPEQAKLHEDLGPITFVHSDFAESYGDMMSEFYTGSSDEAQLGLNSIGISADQFSNARRLLVLQFWRNLGPKKIDLPIAFCEAESVGREELFTFPVTNYAGAGGLDFDTLGVKAPEGERHNWYTFPELGIDEMVVFRTYDSERVQQRRPFWTPHSAFRDPSVELGSPSRSSIELRATCLFL